MPAKRITSARPKRRVLSMKPSNTLNVLKQKRYHAPLHFLHVIAVALELAFQHRFFAQTAYSDGDNHDQTQQQPKDGAEQQRRPEEKQDGAGVHGMSHDRV